MCKCKVPPIDVRYISFEHLKMEKTTIHLPPPPPPPKKKTLCHLDEEQSDISVDSYDVTIYPAESIKNSVTKRAKLR